MNFCCWLRLSPSSKRWSLCQLLWGCRQWWLTQFAFMLIPSFSQGRSVKPLGEGNACSSYTYLTSFTSMLSSCGLWTQRAVWLITKESIRNKQEIKPTDRRVGTWVALLSPTGKNGSLQIARLTLFQCSQAKRAYCWLLTQVPASSSSRIYTHHDLCALDHAWQYVDKDEVIYICCVVPKNHSKGAYSGLWGSGRRWQKRFFTALDFVLSWQKAQM